MPKKSSLIFLFLSFVIVLFSAIIYFQTQSLQSTLSGNFFSSETSPEAESSSSIQDTSSSSQNSSVSNVLSSVSQSISSSISSVSSSVSSTLEIKLREITGQGFHEIFENFQYTKVSPAPSYPVITDNLQVDDHIRRLGEKRGFKKRPYAQENQLVAVDNTYLQTEARDAWISLKNFAKENKVNLIMTSGYRSPPEQRNMFVSSLAPEYPTDDLLSGKIDPELNRIMNTVSLPGYSRHHTGYTIDIACAGESTFFKNTSCYQWMRKDNFANGRRFGWIPSYPEGVLNQGPLPEEWEFVWVGDQAL
jgi:hypothetical protein